MYLFIDVSVDEVLNTRRVKKKKMLLLNENNNGRIAYGSYFNNTIFNIADPSPISKIDRR